MVDGINGNYYGCQFPNGNGECGGLKDDDINTINFIEGEEAGLDDGIEITHGQDLAEIVDKKNFDPEEAHVYAEGEAEIQKEVQRRMLMKATVAGIIMGKTAEEIEAEVRAEYAAKNPEYAAVMEEGQAVEKAHAEAKAEAMKEWEANNPKPEPPNPIFAGVAQMAVYTAELQKWEAERAKHAEAFDESYAKENPNYANLKEQQDAQPNIIDILTSPIIKPKITMNDL